MAKQLICATCGTKGQTKRIYKGSIFIEIILWLCLLIPGLIYSIWRQSSVKRGCRECGSENMVPADSPIGRKIEMQEFEDY